jgi:cytidine deaminase
MRLTARKRFSWSRSKSLGQSLQFPFSPMATEKLSREDRERLLQSAGEATQRAYAPYSHFNVGAALLTSDGKVFTGCNVENASYGLTNCAERTAIFSAVAHTGPRLSIRAIAVVNDQKAPCSPCGACRQVIYEFGREAWIVFYSGNGWKELPIADLLPEGFRVE